METRPGTGAAFGRERWGTTGFDVPALRFLALAFGFGVWCCGLDRFAFTGGRSGFRAVCIPEPDPSAFCAWCRSCRGRVADVLSSGTGAIATAGAGGRLSGSGVNGSATPSSGPDVGAGTETVVRFLGGLLSAVG